MGLYQAFAAGLRRAYGRLPVSGIPEIKRVAGSATERWPG